jgi:hypothetical protein
MSGDIASVHQPVKPSLVRKLAQACNAASGVDKKGKGDHYNWVRWAEVAGALRHELFKRRVILTSEELECETKLWKAMTGAIFRHVTLKVKFTLRDGDSGETLDFIHYGIAMDAADKAIYKAKTGALKYFLKGLGLLPDERDDPEADETINDHTDPRLYQREKEFETRTKGQKRIAAYQQRAFDAACHSSGKTAAQVAEFLKAQFRCASVADIMKSEFDAAMAWAARSEPDYTATLAASVEAKKANGAAQGEPPAVAVAGD